MASTLALTEAQIQNAIKRGAQGLGFRAYHNLYSIGSDRGFPDLVLVGMVGTRQAGRILFIECKGPRGVLSDAQRAWLDDLRAIPGAEVYEAWPHTYDDVLAVLAPPRED